MINRLKKYLQLISYSEKCFILILIGMSLILGLIEVIGISIVVPILGIVLDLETDITNNIPFGNILSDLVVSSGVVNFILIVIFIFFIKFVYVIFLNFLKARLQFHIQKRLSNIFFSKFVYAEWKFLLSNNSSKMTSFVLKEIEIFADLNSSIITLIREIIVLLSIMILLSFFNLFAVIIVMIYAVVFLFIYTLSTKKLLFKIGKLRQELDIDRLNYVQEGFKGVKEIKVYGIEKYFINKLKFLNKKFAKINVSEKTIASIPYSLIEFITICLIMSFVLIFLSKNENPNYLVSLLAIFMAAFMRTLPSFNRLIAVRHNIRFNSYVIDSLLGQYKIIKDYDEKKIIKSNYSFKNDTLIEIKNLFFSYSNNQNSSKNILENINLSIQKGVSIGIIGDSGSGKTTFVDLLLGLHKPTQGSITFTSNNNLIDVKKSIIISYVSQNIFLLNDNFLKNIAFGISEKDIDFEKVKKVAKFAEINEFIESNPDKYNTLIGESGSKISGGQKQRIAIARALYLDPDLIIFDEATNALDANTEKKIINNIYKISKHKTIIMISHNSENINKCDVLFKIDKKNIVQIR